MLNNWAYVAYIGHDQGQRLKYDWDVPNMLNDVKPFPYLGTQYAYVPKCMVVVVVLLYIS